MLKSSRAARVRRPIGRRIDTMPGEAGARPPTLRAIPAKSWERPLGPAVESHLLEDWNSNPFIRGPITAPVVSGGSVFVARPGRARTGGPRRRKWCRPLATDPGGVGSTRRRPSMTGCVWPARAAAGYIAFGPTTVGPSGRLRAAPHDESIVAYGQVESVWPVAGSVLVVDGVAYVAAGRQYLADGGIRVFAVDPPTGQIKWVKRIDDVPRSSLLRRGRLGV